MPEEKLVYEFKGYKQYLLYRSGGKQIRRGLKAQLAKVAGCQPTYISQVLHGKSHLSFEQAERISRFFKHTPDEMKFFMLLVHADRSGTQELKNFYQNQCKQIVEQRLILVNRLGEKNSLTKDQQAIFYSSWHYLALLMALTIPALTTREALAKFFQIELARVEVVLNFLFSAGLAVKQNGKIIIKTNEIRLDKTSPHIFRHHSQWRQQAMESFERESITDLHYSAVYTLSKDDVLALKENMMEFIQATVGRVLKSKEEEICVFNMDFFNLKKSI